MRIVLATGIYPPAIGGPATYSAALAEELVKMGHEVTVVTYGASSDERVAGSFRILSVGRHGNVFTRWMRYAKALREHGENADAIIALSSVSCGIPLILAKLKKPKKILRLGGDFFWERYTDGGGMKSLREWYASSFGFWKLLNAIFMKTILRSFDAVVYSTEFQRAIQAAHYRNLPPVSVIENAAIPETALHVSRRNPLPQDPFRILFMGRFVRFKNLQTLLTALMSLPNVCLTFVGSGPMEGSLRARAKILGLDARVTFRAPVSGQEKRQLFGEHDLLILPSVTEISPNVALEAVFAGLPVLLTSETGFAPMSGLRLRPMRLSHEIEMAIRECMQTVDVPKRHDAVRTYHELAADWLRLLSSL